MSSSWAMVWTSRTAFASYPSSAGSRDRGPSAWLGAGGLMVRILLAEDDAATRDLVQRALGLDGHEVVVTQDGSEALEYLHAAAPPPHMLISDVQMPGLDGIALVEASLKVAPGLRVLLMSGFADELGRAEHLRSKITRVISKPFTLEQIRTAVKGALG